MKNISLGLTFMLLFLPQISFGQSDQQSAADKASIAFYQQQAQARAAYKKLHPDLIAQQDKVSIAFYQQQAQARAAYKKLHPDLIAQQDKVSIAFYQQQAQARALQKQNSLNLPPVTDTSAN